LTLGVFDNFPPNIQFVQSFTSTVPSRQLQEKLIQTLYEINKKEFSFEEVGHPTIPGCRIIFEFGLADTDCFNYIDEEEVKKAMELLANQSLENMDFFCAIRYYKGEGEKKRALKFDYYLIRTVYNRSIFEIQVYHKKGLKYVPPEDLSLFIFNKLNATSNRKALKKQANNPM
jgi:hypothetical protein